MENICENQIGEVLPYQYEPEVGGKGTNISDKATWTGEQFVVLERRNRSRVRNSKCMAPSNS